MVANGVQWTKSIGPLAQRNKMHCDFLSVFIKY